MPLFKVSQQATPIGYSNYEVVDKMKLADYKGTRYHSKCFTKKRKNGFSLPVSHLCSTRNKLLHKYLSYMQSNIFSFLCLTKSVLRTIKYAFELIPSKIH